MSTDARVHVAIDVTPLIGVRTGVGVALAEIIDALHLVDDAPQLVPYALSLRARQHRSALPEGTHFVPLPATFLLRAWTRADAPRIDPWLDGATVVHASNYLAPPSRKPTLVTVYDCSFVRYPELCTPEVRAFEPSLRRAIARGATVHTSSEFVANEIDDIYGPGLRAEGRVVVIPLGVPRVDVDARLPDSLSARLDGSPYVLSIATLEPRKDLVNLVRAFGSVAVHDDALRLVLAGKDGPDRPRIDAALAALPAPIRDRILLAGAVDDPARRALLERAALVAYPSRYEGFGFPVLEAMASGIPVVSTRAGSIPEVAGDAAVLVEPGDPDALASAIERVTTDTELRAALRSRGFAQVERFSWSRTARELMTVYRKLAS
jgi:glycosyltransferase involved in cell wall biosynthesis